MVNSQIQKWQKILHDINSIKNTQPQRTFMQISGFPHYEKVCSNILKFYFDSHNEHDLRDLFYRALLLCILPENEVNPVSEVSAENEVNCDGKFLDLLLESDQYVVGIENKIWAALYNDLDVYASEIERIASEKDLISKRIVLSLRREEPWADFISVTYEDFFSQLKSLIGHYAPAGNNKYLTYLFDFIKTVEALQGGTMAEPETIAFFKENCDEIEDLIANYNGYRNGLNSKINDLNGLVSTENLSNVNQWIWKKSCLVYDFTYDGGTIAMDTYISPKGWRSVLFLRSGKNRAEFDGLIAHLRKEFSLDFPADGNRKQIREWELDTYLGEISEVLESILRSTVEYLKNLG